MLVKLTLLILLAFLVLTFFVQYESIDPHGHREGLNLQPTPHERQLVEKLRKKRADAGNLTAETP